MRTRALPPHGRIVQLSADEGYGFIETADGQLVYFHRNAVTGGGFAKLRNGQGVRLSIADGEGVKGPQATVVTPVGKHHIVGADSAPTR